ncbi:Gfo/Idh/MocA family protein [Natronosalvus vescus]|uniref:Gfo/Idh/MocA family protein n=1 Tax=Natronosalvus vescus TaxID=2953881 RepID=UPI0020908A0F|nr:Gfo/Idh/MocA family oxidoreductase [Natronosalvus vescus]
MQDDTRTDENAAQYPVDVGVVGVGTMGEHHARVYDNLPTANLVGVYDVDVEHAREVADRYDVAATDLRSLLEQVDAVSVAVPTPFHYNTVTTCLDANVAVLVEKPVVDNLEDGKRLKSAVRRSGVPVQVGHIERFNPAVQALSEIVPDLSIIGVKAERLGPPPKREIADNAVLDLMIHDIDVVCSLLGESPTTVGSAGVADNKHASALLKFDSGAIASLTASRLTQRKVRRLQITAESCLIELDYLDQSIQIHRQSVPEYVHQNGDVRYTHESIVEHPRVPNEEPLRNELESFLETVATGTTPDVTLDDGLTALKIATQIDRQGRYQTQSLEVYHD